MIDALVSGAKKSMKAAGVKDENIVVESVPGSYELPLAVQRVYAASQIQSTSATVAGGVGSLASGIGDLLGGSNSTTDLQGSLQPGAAPDEKKDTSLRHAFDAVIAIGVLIKGETMHFEYISESVCHGLMKVQLDTGVPVIFGHLVCFLLKSKVWLGQVYQAAPVKKPRATTTARIGEVLLSNWV